jgi:hypothetical protein
MARKKITRTRTARIRTDASPRHFWLAGLGAVVIAGREGKATVVETRQRILRARKQAVAAAADARSNLLSTVADLRNQIETGTGEMVGKLETAVEPLIAKIKTAMGKPVKAKRTARRGRPVGSKNKNARRTAKKTKTVRRTRKA